ncbi:MAG: 50S ribosomal protein L15 [Patescibacteria group bacterium]
MTNLALHTIKPAVGSSKRRLRVGRGLARKGTTAGRGTKGQKARSGGSHRLLAKSLRQMLLRVPKNRGFNRAVFKTASVQVGALQTLADKQITLAVLRKSGLISRSAKTAKIVGGGELTRAVKLVGIRATEGAKKMIEAAGGQIA